MADEQIPVNDEKVKLGRFLATIGKEDQVLADGVMPNSHFIDRLSLVKGVLDGYFESGHWEQAVKAVYTEGGPVRTLFDGDWDAFRNNVLKSAQDHNRHFWGASEAIQLLHQNDETELLYQLATTIPTLQSNEIEGILNEISEEITPEQRRAGYDLLAERVMKDEGGPRKAYEMYQKGGNMEGINQLYEKLIQEPDNISPKFLLQLATSNDEKEKGRIEELVTLFYPKVTDEKPHESINGSIADSLRTLAEHHDIEVSMEQEECMVCDILGAVDNYKSEQFGSEIVLLWAKRNPTTYPKDKYHLFLKRDYKGPEVLQAALAALQLGRGNDGREDWQKLHLHQIKEEHREKLLESPDVPLQIRAEIAEHDKVYKKLRQFSREFKQEEDYDKAYRAWKIGQGSLTASYAVGLRRMAVEKDLIEREGKEPWLHFLAKDDKPGLVQVYHMMKGKFPEKAYNLAWWSGEETLIDEARTSLMKTLTPEEALERFSGRRYSFDDYDEKGVNLALTAIAEKHGVSEEMVKQYVDYKPKKEEPRRQMF